MVSPHLEDGASSVLICAICEKLFVATFYRIVSFPPIPPLPDCSFASLIYFFMKKLLLVALAFLLYFSVSAQVPGGGFKAGKMPNMPNLGHISGKLVDNAGKPIADASVLILQSK